MKIEEILGKIEGTILNQNLKTATFEGVYAGDLLSHVMAHAKEKNLFLTIMSNMNTIAVASLLELPVIIFAEGVLPTTDMDNKAEEEHILLVATKLNVVEVIRKIYSV